MNGATGGLGGGLSIGKNKDGESEGLRFNFVKNVSGSPSSSADYSDTAPGHSFTGHYSVNDAYVKFGSLSGKTTTASFRIGVDSDADYLVDDAAYKAIDTIRIQRGSLTYAVDHTGADAGDVLNVKAADGVTIL